MKAHPAAEAYRMMTKEELASLAADIKANGLHDPIIVGRVNGADSDAIVDGRNREAACKLAEVEPRYETRQFESEEALRAFVRSRSERRDLTKGQRAMALAILYPSAARGRGKKDVETTGFSRSRLDQARAVLRHSPELAEAVRDGAVSLDDALEQVEASRKELQSNEEKLVTLRARAADLADAVAEERFALSEAYAAFEQRERDAAERERNQREALMRCAEEAYRNVIAFAADGFVEAIYERLDDREFRAELLKRMRLQRDLDLKFGAKTLDDLVRRLTEEETDEHA